MSIIVTYAISDFRWFEQNRDWVSVDVNGTVVAVRKGSSWICMKTTLEKTGFSDGQRSVKASV